jgi:hypothetical protein
MARLAGIEIAAISHYPIAIFAVMKQSKAMEIAG